MCCSHFVCRAGLIRRMRHDRRETHRRRRDPASALRWVFRIFTGDGASRPVGATLALTALLITTGVTHVQLAGAAPPCPTRRYVAPVPDPVDVGFSLPRGQYGPGNRGLEYATPAQRVVRAIGAGEVRFSGTVAGERHVSVRHPDGLISSYSYLASIAVTRGQQVAGGQEIGRSGGRFQLGIRRDGVYLDPTPLLARTLRPRLVGPTATARCDSPASAPLGSGPM